MNDIPSGPTEPGHRPAFGILAGALLTASLLLAACSSPPASDGGPVSEPSGTVVVRMTDQLTFEPAAIAIKVGTKVRWENASSMDHTTTDDPAKAPDPKDAALPSGAETWDSGVLNAGKTFERTFTVPGTYIYFCQPHVSAGMVGRITVTE